MAYQRKYVKRTGKRYSRKSAYTMAKTALKRTYKLANSSERKVINNTNSTAIDTTGTVTLYTNIDGGTKLENRIGNKVNVYGISITGYATINASATNTFIDLFIFYDTMGISDQSAPTVASVYTSTAGRLQLVQNTTHRYRILWHQRMFLSADGKDAIMFKKYINLKKRPILVSWNENGAGSGTETQRNPIYFGRISSEATNTPTIAYNANIFFKDS